MAGGKALQTAFFRAIKAKTGEQWKRSTDLDKADAIAMARLPVQQAVAMDRSKRISVRCPRRAGKSYCAMSIALEQCLRTPRSNWVIVGLTKDSTRAIYWRPLKFLSQNMELGLEFHNTWLQATFPNGSTLRFLGGSTRDEIEKLRGAAYHGVIIDECKSFNPVVFEEMISDVIGPALGDHSGVLYLIGTPGAFLAGPFYEATCEPPIARKDKQGTVRGWSNWSYKDPWPDEPVEWSLHTWTAQDNDSIKEADGSGRIWKNALEEKLRRQWTDDSPSWRREYLGEWVSGDNLLVYRVNSEALYDGELPDGHRWQCVMGADFGYRDAFAVVVWAYSPTYPGLFEVASVKAERQTIPGMIDIIRRVEDSLPGEVVCRVGDPGYGGLNIMATLGEAHELPFITAEKSKKVPYISHLNDDMERGLIHLRRHSALTEEMLQNRWLERSIGKVPVEDPATPNDLCDSALYAWRFCQHRYSTEPASDPDPGTADWWRAMENAQIQRVIDRETRKDSDEIDSDRWGN